MVCYNTDYINFVKMKLDEVWSPSGSCFWPQHAFILSQNRISLLLYELKTPLSRCFLVCKSDQKVTESRVRFQLGGASEKLICNK